MGVNDRAGAKQGALSSSLTLTTTRAGGDVVLLPPQQADSSVAPSRPQGHPMPPSTRNTVEQTPLWITQGLVASGSGGEAAEALLWINASIPVCVSAQALKQFSIMGKIRSLKGVGSYWTVL